MWSLIKKKKLLSFRWKIQICDARDILGSSNHHLLISQDKKKSLLFEKGATLDGYKCKYFSLFFIHVWQKNLRVDEYSLGAINWLSKETT